MEQRNYKFRAWDKKDKEMISASTLGELLYQAKHGLDINYAIDNFIFQQWTGLNDVHGKPIFELMQLDSKYRVLWIAPKYVLQDIFNGDIIDIYDKPEITAEYSPI